MIIPTRYCGRCNAVTPHEVHNGHWYCDNEGCGEYAGSDREQYCASCNGLMSVVAVTDAPVCKACIKAHESDTRANEWLFCDYCNRPTPVWQDSVYIGPVCASCGTERGITLPVPASR